MQRRSLRSRTPSRRLFGARAAEEDALPQRGRKRTRTPSPASPRPEPTTTPRLKLTLGKQRTTQDGGVVAASSRSPTIEGVKDTPPLGHISERYRMALIRQNWLALRTAPNVISDEEEEGSPLGGSPSEEDEVVESAIPPSAQTLPSNISKRRKSDKASTSRRRVSRSPSSDTSTASVYSLGEVSFPMNVQVFVGKAKAFSKEINSESYNHNDMIDDYRGELLLRLMPKKKRVDDPPFGGEFTINAARMKRPYTLTIGCQKDFETACRKWWDILHEPKRAAYEMSAQLILIYEERAIRPSSPPPGQTSSGSDGASSTRSRHEDSTQGRRRKDKERLTSKSKKSKTAAPSATQIQRQQRAHRAEVLKEAGDQQLVLTQRHKCLRQNCKNNPRVCYDQPGIGHLAVSLPFTKIWCDAVASGTATIEEPPIPSWRQ